MQGDSGFCILTDKRIYVGGTYYVNYLHKLTKHSGTIAIDLKDIMRVGITKTYSRRMFAIPMLFGALALISKAIPAIEFDIPIFGLFDYTVTLWSFAHQDTAFLLFGLLFLATIPLYWLSYRKLLEINTLQGGYCITTKGVDKAKIDNFCICFNKYK